MADPLTADELRELSRLFSLHIANIHRLPHLQTQVLMKVDEHMRDDTLTREDLEGLRRIQKDARR